MTTLYHGTSEQRWRNIQLDGLLKVAPYGVECVSTSTEKTVAEYFAKLASDSDNSVPVILTMQRTTLEEAGLEVGEFEDDVWGTGECAWEKEVACWENIPVSFVTKLD